LALGIGQGPGQADHAGIGNQHPPMFAQARIDTLSRLAGH
jgi:hypothetical protein